MSRRSQAREDLQHSGRPRDRQWPSGWIPDNFGREPGRAGWVDMFLDHEPFEVGITPPVLVVGADIAEAVNIGMVDSGDEAKNWWLRNISRLIVNLEPKDAAFVSCVGRPFNAGEDLVHALSKDTST